MRAKRSFVRPGGTSFRKVSVHSERSSSIFNDPMRLICVSNSAATTAGRLTRLPRATCLGLGDAVPTFSINLFRDNHEPKLLFDGSGDRTAHTVRLPCRRLD